MAWAQVGVEAVPTALNMSLGAGPDRTGRG